MTKKIIFLTSLVLIYTIYNYHINKGFPLIVFFICLIILAFSISKIYSDSKLTDENTFEYTEKKYDKIYNNEGIFEYKGDGFYLKQNGTKDFIKWNEIETVIYFDYHVLKNVNKTGIEIETSKKIYKIHNNDEQTLGIEKFENELNKNINNKEFYNSEVLSDGSSRTPLFIKSKT